MWAAMSSAPSAWMATSPTASCLPSLSRRASAIRSPGGGFLRKLIVRLVVTASGTQPMADKTARYREIHSEIAKGHHCGAGKRAAWPQGTRVVALTQAAAAAPELFDLIIPHGMAGIREFDAKPVEKLLARQRRRSHLNRSSQLRVRPFSIRHGTCIPPRVSIQCCEPIAKSAGV